MTARHDIAGMLAAAVTQSADPILVTDTEGVIVYVNPAFERLTGYKAEEVAGKKPSILKSGRQDPAFYKDMWDTLKAGRAWTGRLTNKRADGSLYDEKVVISPVRGPDGGLRHFFAQIHDITRELALESQLFQSQKMESLGLLAGQTAHDFNNLLTVIIGSMELIQEDLAQGAVTWKLASEILRSSKEHANLIRQLMMFTRRAEVKPAKVSINDAVGEMKALIEAMAGKGVRVAFDLTPEISPVMADPDQLKQALMNLGVNARDAMAARGVLTISTRSAGPAGLPPAIPEGRYTVLEVADTGPGIPENILPRIFEPFFTTKPKGKGTGLGLSSVYGAVSQAHGKVLAANRPAGGAVFTIYLPEASA